MAKATFNEATVKTEVIVINEESITFELSPNEAGKLCSLIGCTVGTDDFTEMYLALNDLRRTGKIDKYVIGDTVNCSGMYKV